MYEFVVRRFLGCCSEDATGESTTVNLQYGDEFFHASGLVVLQRNYLEVYTYDHWESSQQLPRFTQGETFVPTEANITEGKTGPPGYLTEPELIALMDANGIGTDATMAEHIAKIVERQYVFAQPKSRAASGPAGEDEEDAAGAGRGRGRGRGRGARGGGRGRGRGSGRGGAAATASSGRGGMQEFIPSNLGIALVEGYDTIGFDMSLSKPFLRKEVMCPPSSLSRRAGGKLISWGNGTDGTKNEANLRRHNDPRRRRTDQHRPVPGNVHQSKPTKRYSQKRNFFPFLPLPPVLLVPPPSPKFLRANEPVVRKEVLVSSYNF